MTDGMIKLKAHAAYYRKCEADAMTPSQAAIAEWQAKALEHAIESIGALPDLAPKVENYPAYNTLIGEAGEVYLKSIAFQGQHNLPAQFRWHHLWGALNDAALQEPTEGEE